MKRGCGKQGEGNANKMRNIFAPPMGGACLFPLPPFLTLRVRIPVESSYKFLGFTNPTTRLFPLDKVTTFF